MEIISKSENYKENLKVLQENEVDDFIINEVIFVKKEETIYEIHFFFSIYYLYTGFYDIRLQDFIVSPCPQNKEDEIVTFIKNNYFDEEEVLNIIFP
jgi:hypothetical protein